MRTQNTFLALLIIIIYAIPSVIFVCFHQDSLATGMIATCLIVLMYAITALPKVVYKTIYFIFFLFFLLCVILQSAYFYIEYNLSKPILSIPALLILFITSVALSKKMESISFSTVIDALRLSAYFFFICGWLAILFKFKPGPYFAYEKPVIPFSEESHYALCVGFISCISGFFSTNKQKVFIFGNLVGQSVTFPSLTLFIFTVLSIIIFWFAKNIVKLFLFGFVFLTLLTLSVSYFSDTIAFQYFSSRLDFSSDGSNMTTLVFLQGIDDAYRSFINTNGVGLGFQMAGTDQPGQYGYTIAHMSGSFLNRADGGFVASKLITEFGVFGVGILLWYLKRFFQSTLYLSSYSFEKDNDDSFTLLGFVALIVFSVEFLLRGYGYFSPGILLFFTLYQLSGKNKAYLRDR